MKWYLGIQPSMAFVVAEFGIPYFLSVHATKSHKAKPEKGITEHFPGDWMLDSGGFGQIKRTGSYTMSEDEYVDIVLRQKPFGAFIQDWPCELNSIQQSGKSMDEHQDLTLKSYLSLHEKAGDVMCPVLTGQEPETYVRHLEMYKSAGVDCSKPIFGIGAIVKKKPKNVEWVVRGLKEVEPNIKLHGFGLKTGTLCSWYVCNNIISADSHAWSKTGQSYKMGCPNCEATDCSRCLRYAMMWRENVNNMIRLNLGTWNFFDVPGKKQMSLFEIENSEAKGKRERKTQDYTVDNLPEGVTIELPDKKTTSKLKKSPTTDGAVKSGRIKILDNATENHTND